MRDDGIFCGMTSYDWYDALRTLKPTLTWEAFMKDWNEFWDEREIREQGRLN